MSFKSRLSFIAVSFIVLLISIIFFYYKSQTIYTGSFEIKNSRLSAPIKLHMDEHGFTHIKAENRLDAFFALGVAHARDRLWQMEFLRRLASGTLSEVLGNKTLKIDKMARTLGFRRTAEKDVQEIIRYPEHKMFNNYMARYIEGINFWANTHTLPLEYWILWMKYENWTIIDSYSIFRLLSFSMTLDHTNELLNTLINDYLGKEYFDILYRTTMFDYPYSNETVVNEEEIEEMGLKAKRPLNIKDKDTLFESVQPPEMKVKVSSVRESPIDYAKNEQHASNSWVVSGNHTPTGKPILSNDPHLGNAIPGQHYIVKFYIKDTNETIVGTCPPGIPVVIIGNNKNLAFGFTTDNRDISDFVEEKIDNSDISKAKYYYVDGEKKSLDVVYEKIKIKNQPDIEYEVKLTRNGPLLESFIQEFGNAGLDYTFKSSSPNSSNALSISISIFKKPLTLNYFYGIMFAEKKEDFLSQLDDYVGPSFALIWATTKNEIGYTPIGHFIIKDNPKQIFAKGYSTKEYPNEINPIPRKDTPVLVNPKKGFIATANGSPVPFSYKWFSTHYSYHFRFYRISQLLKEVINKKKYTVEDSLHILGDTKDLFCEIMRPKMVNILKSQNVDTKNELFIMLDTFNCNFDKDSKEATLYSVYEYKLIQYLLLKNKNNNVNVGFKNKKDVRGFFTVHTMFYMLNDILTKLPTLPTCSYFTKGHNCAQFVKDVFDNLPNFLSEEKCVDIKGKVLQWDKVHYHYYAHSFDSNKLMRRIFSRKVATNGNRNTIKVSKTQYSLENPFTSIHSANMKFINDLSDITRPYLCLDTGNSGNLMSKFYDNQMVDCELNKLYKIENYDFNNEQNDLTISPSKQ